jgi:hypothetical protein
VAAVLMEGRGQLLLIETGRMHGDQASDGLHPELTNCCSVEVAGGCQARLSWGVPTFRGLTGRSRPHGRERQVGQGAGWDRRAPYRIQY